MPSIGRSPSVALLRSLALALAVLVWGLVPAGGAPATAAATPAQSVTPDHTGGWQWPVEGPFGEPPEVLRGFDPPEQPWLAGHRGVDLAAVGGDAVLAAGPGTVVFAGPLAGRGVVSVDHPGGLRTTYEPVTALVVAGEAVVAGEPIATLEPLTTHCALTCLHWGLRRGEVYLDPLSLLHRAPPVLLPYGPPVQVPPPQSGPVWSWPG